MNRCIGWFQFVGLLMMILILAPAAVYAVEPDAYEQDNTFSQAKVIILKDEFPQTHNFHESGDQDWVKFYGLEGKKYEIEASNVGADCDVVIELYDTDGESRLLKANADLEGGTEKPTSEPLSADGIYYVKVSDDSASVGENTGYDLRLMLQNAPVSSRFQGSTVNTVSKAPLGNVMIKTDQDFTALSDQGSYIMYHPLSQTPTAYTLTAAGLPGYETFTKPVFTVKTETETYFETETSGGNTRSERVRWDGVIKLVPLRSGNINGDDKIDLADAVLGLQALAGAESEKIRKDYIESCTDVSGDNKIGMEEVTHILNILQHQDI